MYIVSSSVGFFTTAKNDVFIFYVILSASEISHDQSEKVGAGLAKPAPTIFYFTVLCDFFRTA